MNKNSKILVLGGSGLAGSSIVNEFRKAGYESTYCPNRQELDLMISQDVSHYFKNLKPDLIVFAAAKVGGIYANNTYRADFILKNLMIQTNCFAAALESKTRNFIFLGSNCIYPKKADQPLKEESLLDGFVEPTNEPYAIAKIAGIKTAESINLQHGLNYFSLIPTSLYGENDNFRPDECHVVAGLINRMSVAVQMNQPSFEVWGTGKPTRELMHADDLGRAIVYLCELEKLIPKPFLLNIGSKEEISVKELTSLIANEFNYKGDIIYNADKPNGAMRKAIDSSKIFQLGWRPSISLEEGIKRTIQSFKENKCLRK